MQNIPGHTMDVVPVRMTILPKLTEWTMPAFRSTDRFKMLTILKKTPTEVCFSLVFVSLALKSGLISLPRLPNFLILCPEV